MTCMCSCRYFRRMHVSAFRVQSFRSEMLQANGLFETLTHESIVEIDQQAEFSYEKPTAMTQKAHRFFLADTQTSADDSESKNQIRNIGPHAL